MSKLLHYSNYLLLLASGLSIVSFILFFLSVPPTHTARARQIEFNLPKSLEEEMFVYGV